MEFKKDLEQVMTPKIISDYMVKECLSNWKNNFPEISIKDIQILEPSVGQGVFIESILEFLKLEYEKEGLNYDEKYIFKNNIYAMDIDVDMINYCIDKFNLNSINHNFICCNTLLYDFKDMKFDIVIGNPPYIKERGNKEAFEKINQSAIGKKYHQSKMDFWFYFLHLAMDNINQYGNIAFITPRYWINSSGSSKLIERIKNELYFSSIVDIGKLTVFDEVAGHHMIAIYTKKKNDEFIYKKLINDLRGVNENNLNTKKENIKIKKLNYNNIFSKNNEIILEKDTFEIKYSHKLGDLVDVSQGVVEATDKISKNLMKKTDRRDIYIGKGIFVLTNKEMEALELTKEEMKYIKKYICPKDIDKYFVNKSNLQNLIYSDNICKELIKTDKNFINFKKHLDDMQEFITSSNKPYGLHRPRKINYFTNCKIIFKGMFKTNEFAFDEEGLYFGMSFLSIVNKINININLKYVLSVLNSKLALYWFYQYGKHRGIGVDIGVAKLKEFPMIKLSEQEQKPFIELVEQIIEIKKQGQDTKDLENKIDEMVYGLYELTEEEKEIVRNFKS